MRPTRIDVRRIGQLKDGEEVVGQRVRCKVVKNKVAPPFRIAEFDMMHTHGISYEGDLLDLGITQKVLNRSGSWFKYGDIYMGQGKEKARQYLVDNPSVAEEIRNKIMSMGVAAAVATEGEEGRPEIGFRTVGFGLRQAAQLGQAQRDTLHGHRRSPRIERRRLGRTGGCVAPR